uniref:Metallo-beta-lactamase domain-containing protein n=1 Tax=Strombidium rassoulzadegani TaxID=1082188 RepID=A0A7S3CQE4_9SPIT
MTSLNIRWLGHAGFKISFPDQEGTQRSIYVDAWLQNPLLPAEYKDKTVDDADLVLVTHGHFDHSSSAPDIVNKSTKQGVKLISNFEIGEHFKRHAGVEEGKIDRMNKGGTIDYGFCKITQVSADHSSCCVTAEGHIESGGEATGFVIHIPQCNARIYHGGDTNVFSDMKIIEDLYHPNILMIPIGDRFTMGPEGAAYACANFFKSAKHILPMHFGTFPLLTGTYEDFVAKLGDYKVDTALLVNTPNFKDSDLCLQSASLA